MHIHLKRLLSPLRKGWIGILIVSMITAGCEWGDKNVALIRPNTDNLQVVFTDTVTVLRSTVMKDSLYTASGFMLAGLFSDQVLGSIQAKANLLVSAAGLSVDERAVYDSIVFVSKYGYYYGDTTKLYQVAAHELLADITRGPFYNHREVPHSVAPLGRTSFFPRPKGSDSLRIRLSDELGVRLFTEAKANNIKNQEALLKYFKGITLVAERSNGVGFLGYAQDKTNILLHYHVDGPDGKVKHVTSMAIGQFYNQITNNRTGTVFDQLKQPRQKLSTDLTDGVSVVQSGVGLMTRLDFPFLQQFGAEHGKVIVNRAFLRIQLPRNEETRGMAVPQRIALYRTGPNSDWTNTGDNIVQVGTFEHKAEENLRYYEIDVSQEVMALSKLQQASTVGYLIGPIAATGNAESTYSNTLDRLILPKGSVKLHVYFSTLYNE
ncbi:DUF4270 family protein [Ravibacter arvi]|uniref:DUF4270 family protein n=1 Tax=Ravibacter arvi TaxID=2051041 RepID=A0ABP8LZA5_9BACT